MVDSSSGNEVIDGEGYQVQTEKFAGPLDLLLYLIRKNKMNILDIRISEITSEYLYYLRNNPGIDPTREGDFLMTASTLIYIKSRSLLPRPAALEDESPEKKLIHTLIEYDKIQKISQLLKQMENETLMLWRRDTVSENFETKEYSIEEISTFQLAETFLTVLRKKDREEFLYIESKNYSLENKTREILDILDKDGFLDFNRYADGLGTIQEVLISFFAILEMVKQHFVIAVQKRIFDTISIWKQERAATTQ